MQPPKSQPRLSHNGGPPLDDLLSMTIRTAMRITGFSKDTWIFYSEPLPAARNLLILLRRVWNLALM